MECVDYCESLREHQMLYYESMNHIIDFSKKKKNSQDHSYKTLLRQRKINY